MAEQSMFWPTTGTGDGISGGYTDARLKTIWKAALGNGVLQYQNNLNATGTGTSTLAVNTGAAMVEGYLYENDSSASIATTSLGSATYGLYVIANEDASALAVSRSVAGTTVAAKSTRLALNSTTPAQPNIKIATVVTSGGSITSITAENNRYASSRVKTVGSSTIAVGLRTTNLSTTSGINSIVTFSSATDSNYVTVATGTGIFTIKESGVYNLQSTYEWAVSGAGTRYAFMAVNGNTDADSLTQFGAIQYMQMNVQMSLSAGDAVTFFAQQTSGGALNLIRARCSIARLG